MKTYTTENPINSAAISSAFPHVILGGGQEASQVTTTSERAGKFEAKLYNMVYDEEIGRVKGHFGPINTVAFSPDGKQYVSGGEDGFVRLHDFDDEYFEKSRESL
jgi:translation initiation factor 3 subunit I